MRGAQFHNPDDHRVLRRRDGTELGADMSVAIEIGSQAILRVEELRKRKSATASANGFGIQIPKNILAASVSPIQREAATARSYRAQRRPTGNRRCAHVGSRVGDLDQTAVDPQGIARRGLSKLYSADVGSRWPRRDRLEHRSRHDRREAVGMRDDGAVFGETDELPPRPREHLDVCPERAPCPSQTIGRRPEPAGAVARGKDGTVPNDVVAFEAITRKQGRLERQPVPRVRSQDEEAVGAERCDGAAGNFAGPGHDGAVAVGGEGMNIVGRADPGGAGKISRNVADRVIGERRLRDPVESVD